MESTGEELLKGKRNPNSRRCDVDRIKNQQENRCLPKRISERKQGHSIRIHLEGQIKKHQKQNKQKKYLRTVQKDKIKISAISRLIS